VRIDIPDHPEPLLISGIVVWSKPNGAAGIRFANMNDTQKEVLQGWLSDLEKAALNPGKREDDEFTRIVSKVRAAKLNNADALNLIVSYVTEITSANGAAIALGTAETMVCMAAAGVAPEIGTSIPSGVGLTGECVRRRKMVHCQNAQNDPRVGRDLNLGSAVVLPLLVNGELRGILEAVSLSVYAFDSTAIDKLERLADAVVFLTFGVVPQRRIATVTPLTPGTMTRLSVPGSLRNAPAQSVTRTVPTVTTKPAATPTPPALKPIVPEESKPASVVATFPLPAVTPKPQPSPAKPIAIAPRPVVAKTVVPGTLVSVVADPIDTDELDSVAKRISARYTESYEPEPKSFPVKWVVAALVVMVLIGGPVLVWRYKAGKSTNTPPVVEAASTNSEQNLSSQSAVGITPTAAPTPTPMAATVTTPTKPATATKAAETETTVAHHEPAAEKSKSARPTAPIVLAESGSLRRAEIDDDVVIPSASQIPVPTSSSVPDLGLPTTASVPKLSAPVAKVPSGGTLLKQVAPVYPQLAKSMHLEGTVELRLTIGKDGSVLKAQRISGHTILANAAIEAVKRWRYDSFRLDGEPVEAESTVRLKFTAPR
jgi:TonB family protein